MAACIVCDVAKMAFCWTDTHGVAQCSSCGTPYRLFHYEDGKRVEKAPETTVRDAWIPLLRKFRAETGGIIPSGHSFPGGQEMAKAEDFQKFNNWCDAHKAELPAPLEQPA